MEVLYLGKLMIGILSKNLDPFISPNRRPSLRQSSRWKSQDVFSPFPPESCSEATGVSSDESSFRVRQLDRNVMWFEANACATWQSCSSNMHMSRRIIRSEMVRSSIITVLITTFQVRGIEILYRPRRTREDRRGNKAKRN